MRGRLFRRNVRKKKISRRKSMIIRHSLTLDMPLTQSLAEQSVERQEILSSFSIGAYVGMGQQMKIFNAVYGNKGGLLAKHDYGALTFGTPEKTKTKRMSASYRHKGSYGQALFYAPHDKRQLERMMLIQQEDCG